MKVQKISMMRNVIDWIRKLITKIFPKPSKIHLPSSRVKKIYISRIVIDEITSYIASQQPESGGLLMGPPDKDAITFFQYDQWSFKSGTIYKPNAENFSEIAKKIKSQTGWIVKGVVHSHPRSMSSLSEGDRRTINPLLSL